MKKQDLFYFMISELRENPTIMNDKDYPSIDTFLSVWLDNFSELKIPAWNTLGTCDFCLYYKLELVKYKKTTQQYDILKMKYNEHLKQVKQERIKQKERDNYAVSYPETSWTITTDLMQDLFLPWLPTGPKSWWRKQFVPLKVFGYINCGTSFKYVFII